MSGYDEADCLHLLSDALFGGRPLPPVQQSIPNVDVSTLPDRVRARVGVDDCRVDLRGIKQIPPGTSGGD